MKRIQIDSVFLFILIIPFIMGYRISPFTTQYWMFGLVFLSLLLYIGTDFLSIKQHYYDFIKNTILWLLIIATIGGSLAHAVKIRHKTHPIFGVHDIILQQEAAIRAFVSGKNPYAITYFDTPLELWHYSETEENPALYHFVMEPFYFISAIPFYAISNRVLGYFDARLPLFFFSFLSVLIAHLLIRDGEKKRLFISALAFHPAMLPYTLEGRSDLYMHAFLFGGCFLLHKKKYVLAAILIAIAFATKQSAWLLLPFYIIYLFCLKNKKIITVSLVSFFLVFSIIVLPFYFWNQQAFMDSTISFLNGMTVHSYPITGYGLGGMLVEFGIITNKHSFYPFYIWQAVICGPLLIGLILFLKKNPTVQRLISVYAIFLFVYWYLSRYFHNSHLAYISYLFLTAYFWPNKEEQTIQKEKTKRNNTPQIKRKRLVHK